MADQVVGDETPTTVDAWVEMLLTHIRADERDARNAPGHEWTGYTTDDIAGPAVYDEQWVIANATRYTHRIPLSNKPGATGPHYIDPDATTAHIARWDPKRVLAECEAKRELVVLLKAQVELGGMVAASLRRVQRDRYLLERIGQPYGMPPLPAH